MSVPLRGAVVAAAVLLGPLTHPIHTTHTELVERDGAVTVTIRAFTEDLEAAVRRTWPKRTLDDSALASYARSRLLLLDREGRCLPLSWRGRRTAGGLTFLDFLVRARSLTGVRVGNSLHFELFPDQVNVIQARYRSRSETLLFTPGSPSRVLP